MADEPKTYHGREAVDELARREGYREADATWRGSSFKVAAEPNNLLDDRERSVFFSSVIVAEEDLPVGPDETLMDKTISVGSSDYQIKEVHLGIGGVTRDPEGWVLRMTGVLLLKLRPLD